jgi:hypothetical protein
MPGITVTLDRADLNKLEYTLSGIKNGARDALRIALNKTLDGTATDAAKILSAKINLTQKVIKANFRKFKATNDNLGAKFESRGKKVPLVNYGARQTQKGVTVQVLKANPRKLLPHAFIATMRSGHKGAFWREWHNYGLAPSAKPKKKIPWKRMPSEYRLSIHELFGPRIEDVLGKDAVFGELTDKAQARMDKELDAAINYVLLKSQGAL